MKNDQQTAVESYKIYCWRKKKHMAGFLNTALSITWFSMEMSIWPWDYIMRQSIIYLS